MSLFYSLFFQGNVIQCYALNTPNEECFDIELFFIIIRYKLVFVGYKICFHILVILTITSSCKELWKCSIGAFRSNLLLNPFNTLRTFFPLIFFIYNSLIQSLINIYQRSTEYVPGTHLITDTFSLFIWGYRDVIRPFIGIYKMLWECRESPDIIERINTGEAFLK